MGAQIHGIGTNTLEIQGVEKLYSTEITTIPDRIETGTLLIAAAITNGDITLTEASSEHLEAVLLKLEDCGCKITRELNQISIDSKSIKLKPVSITTSIFPGFLTDMQAQWIALMSMAEGTSIITDTIYRDRFMHVPELIRLGANITVKENIATVVGVKKLIGAKVMSTDLRICQAIIIWELTTEEITVSEFPVLIFQ